MDFQVHDLYYLSKSHLWQLQMGESPYLDAMLAILRGPQVFVDEDPHSAERDYLLQREHDHLGCAVLLCFHQLEMSAEAITAWPVPWL